MTSSAKSLGAFLDAAPAVAFVEVADAKGSTPREKGAWMLVSSGAIYGTIGGGQLEFMAIDRAREMLGGVAAPASLDIPLGPEIDQCCGGRVEVAIALVDEAKRGALLQAAKVRLRPILMTTLAMIFGMVPLAFALTEGSEQRAPMGQAVIGGVITSSLLTLVVVPVVYCYLDDLANWLRRRPRTSAGGGSAGAVPASRIDDLN